MGDRPGDALPPVRFDTHPDRYRHWRLELPSEHGGAVARLVLDVDETAGLRPGYTLKLNSYDLSVDIELADALQRIRFEHPEVKALAFASAKDRVFSAGANIYMLGSSGHGFKVNFCKFTNETRLYLEELSAESGVESLAALGGTASGGGYELALACDAIALADDGASVVSLPEAPLLGVLPGTGGLTRLVDKRKVRRDLADAFSTMAEGVRGERALAWGLVDEAPTRREFDAAVRRRLDAMIGRSRRLPARAIALEPLGAYRHVSVARDARTRVATLTMSAPTGAEPETPEELAGVGSDAWAIRAWRELDDALLDLRFNHPGIGLVVLRTSGDPARVLAVDAMIARHRGDGLVHETALLMKRVLKRLDNTAKTLFALVEPDTCFAGSLAELVLAADRSFMLDDPDREASIQLSTMNAGPLPMSNGLTRLASRFLGRPGHVGRVLERTGPFDAKAALDAGLVTFAPDAIDWEDEVRIAVEERASLSPDALTGLEASLRYGGPETMETKIFGRLSSWQNWIFQRPNAVGPRGALALYGKAERPEFDFDRT
ncbi:MAG TPA: 2,3-epoxybenzoyl-CoA dihydrolase [Polyangiaceae bacterium]|nr:2,3-epoxybenzoyl-CoA dihydrolase [Polyangiaceae bacterium]